MHWISKMYLSYWSYFRLCFTASMQMLTEFWTTTQVIFEKGIQIYRGTYIAYVGIRPVLYDYQNNIVRAYEHFKYRIDFCKDNAGGNDIVSDDDNAAEYYTIQGIRIDKPEKGNLYIERRGPEVRKIVFWLVKVPDKQNGLPSRVTRLHIYEQSFYPLRVKWLFDFGGKRFISDDIFVGLAAGKIDQLGLCKNNWVLLAVFTKYLLILRRCRIRQAFIILTYIP